MRQFISEKSILFHQQQIEFERFFHMVRARVSQAVQASHHVGWQAAADPRRLSHLLSPTSRVRERIQLHFLQQFPGCLYLFISGHLPPFTVFPMCISAQRMRQVVLLAARKLREPGAAASRYNEDRRMFMNIRRQKIPYICIIYGKYTPCGSENCGIRSKEIVQQNILSIQ